MPEDTQLQSMIVDLRRGTLALAVLSCLNGARYGYSLMQSLESHGVHIEANTLYPLLRRLETQGLLQSQWDTAESRPRKYYTLSGRGRELYARLKDEWRRMTREIEHLLREDEANEHIN